jgi:S-adenosylmethionine decarboxylase
MTGAGQEWIVDAHGCRPEHLADLGLMRELCDRACRELELRVLEKAWHQFPPPGGVTGLYLLAESHLACHTYPETGFATINLYCCRPRAEWPWPERLAEALGAERVTVRRVERGG